MKSLRRVWAAAQRLPVPHARSAHKARISAELKAGNRKERLRDYASFPMPKATIEIPVQIERISM